MKKRPFLAVIAAASVLLTGCALTDSESKPELPLATGKSSSAAETEPVSSEETAPAEPDEGGAQDAAAFLLHAGEMKLPSSDQDEKTGMLFRFTAVSAESCNLTWDAYRITDSANDIGRGITVNGKLFGDQQVFYAPVKDADGTVTGYILDGVTLTKTAAKGQRDYQLLVSLAGAGPQLMLIPADGSGDQLAVTSFAPELNEYEWVALASASDGNGESLDGMNGLFYTQGKVLMMDGSLFGSPKEDVEGRIGYSIGELQPLEGWAMPLERATCTYNDIILNMVFRSGSLTAVYADYAVDDPYTLFNEVADDAVKAYGTPDAAYTDETEHYVESWYLADQNITLYLYTYTETVGDTDTVYFRQEYTVGDTDRFCGF